MKTEAIRFYQTGTKEVLKFEEIDLPEPKENEVLISQKFIGVNFIDTYYRSGLYPVQLPSGLGTEASGVIEKVGNKVTHLKAGDRVTYAQGPLGAYAKKRVIAADKVILLPSDISFEAAAAMTLKGLTVSYLFQDVHPLQRGDTILFHAAAGGVGLIACQWAKYLGVKLIGTVSSEAKARLIQEMGAYAAINYTQEKISQRVLEITGHKKVSVVYDSVGADTWEESLNSLSPKGLMVSFGNTTGPVRNVDLGILAQKGGLFVTRPMLAHYIDTYEKLQTRGAQLFELVKEGVITPHIDSVFKLKDAAFAHQELLERSRVGTILLEV